MKQTIRILGARQHNLKGLDLELPRRALTVLTGPSGSGKSTLAFDTIYAEGQRRYIESLSTYAKQFLERMEKPAVDRLEGVSPSVAIDQRNAVKTSRSTVGTVTEVYDYMRLLWARVGRTFCPECGRRVVPDTVQSAADELLADWPAGTRLQVTFPLRLSDEITHAVAVENLQAQGYLRVLADGGEHYLPDLEGGQAAAGADPGLGGGAAGADPDRGAAAPEAPDPDLAAAAELLVIVDRLALDPEPESRERLADAFAAAFAEGEGRAVVFRMEERPSGLEVIERRTFSEEFRCAECGRDFPEPRPSLFSFNSPAGACPKCTGFGATLEYDAELIVPDPSLSLEEGAIDPWEKPRYEAERAALRRFARRRGIDLRAPWHDLPEEARRDLLQGADGFEGVFPFLRARERKRYKRYIRVFLRRYQRPRVCDLCGGARLRPELLNVRVGGMDIAAASALDVSSLRERLAEAHLTPFEAKVAALILAELEDRLGFLEAVGLGYLTLDRQSRTLSGGEMQRIRLASCLGSRLVDTLYVLDEPTIGLHPADVDRFLDVLGRLRDGGNTVLVVEHEPRVLERADHIVELGPGSGERGGEVVFEGSWDGLRQADTTTGRALRERGRPRRDVRRRRTAAMVGRPSTRVGRRAARPGARREPPARTAGPGLELTGPRLVLRGARLHNLRGVDVALPLGALTVVTGVSGSGKSTLVHDVLFHALEKELDGRTSAREHLGEATGGYESLEGVGALDGVVLVDQSPIGRTPRSNPVTYIKAFDEIRRIFAEQPLSRSRGYEAGHFSFNVAGGRCEACKGAGEEAVEMVFMADIFVPCEACGGTRYRPEVLEIEYRGRSIHDVLRLTVDEAIRFFIRQDRLGECLWQLQRVGLGYLRLGQPATTLSGGEAQRLKIARELARGGGGRRLYILDEPTVGLGLGEIGRLMDVLEQLVSEGHTVLLVEHNLDVLLRADWIVDLGPGPGAAGGRVVAAGPPEAVARARESRTGAFLRRHLEEVEELERPPSAEEGSAPSDRTPRRA